MVLNNGLIKKIGAAVAIFVITGILAVLGSGWLSHATTEALADVEKEAKEAVKAESASREKADEKLEKKDEKIVELIGEVQESVADVQEKVAENSKVNAVTVKVLEQLEKRLEKK